MRINALSTWTKAIVFATGVTVALSECSSAETVPQETKGAQSAETITPSESAGDDHTEASSSAPATVSPAEVPAGIPDIGVPIYPDAKQVKVHAHSGPVSILEYRTCQSRATVNTFVREALSKNKWNVTHTAVEGKKTVSKARKGGYFLIIVVTPDDGNQAATAIHYTLKDENHSR